MSQPYGRTVPGTLPLNTERAILSAVLPDRIKDRPAGSGRAVPGRISPGDEAAGNGQTRGG